MNVKHPREYVRRVRAGEPLELEQERLTGWNSVGETIMLGLRLNEGVDLRALAARYHLPVEEHYQRPIERLIKQGRLEKGGSRIWLTPTGRLFANDVAMEFLE